MFYHIDNIINNKWGRYCIALVPTFFMCSCDEYNTNVLGTRFNPANALVSQFVHPVYIEYKDSDIRIWGPYKDLIDYQIDGQRLSITSVDDSLALLVYGNAVGDTAHYMNGQLKISIDRDFALYLNGLKLHSNSGPAIEVQADEQICYLVVSNNSKNVLSDSLYQTQYHDGSIQEADGCLYVSGQLYLDGKGQLTIQNAAEARYDADLGDSIYTHALYARGGVICNYALQADLTSLHGDAIHTSGSEVKLLNGTWHLYPGRDTISTEGAAITIGESAKIFVNDSIYNTNQSAN